MPYIQNADANNYYNLTSIFYMAPGAVIWVSQVLYDNSAVIAAALIAGEIIDYEGVGAPQPDAIPHQFETEFQISIRSGATATSLQLQFLESIGGFEDSAGNLHDAGDTFITFRVELVDNNGNYLLWEDLQGEDPGDGSICLTLTNDATFKSGQSYPGTLGSGVGEYDLTDAVLDNFIVTAEVSGGGGGAYQQVITVAKGGGDFTSIQAAIDFANPIVHSGTAQAGAAATITLAAAASATDDYYNGMKVRLTGGTGSGQIRTIVDYVGSTKVATVDSNWTVNPDATTTYAVKSVITVSVYSGEYNEAITLKDCVDIVAIDPQSTKILQAVIDNNVACFCYLRITLESTLTVTNANSEVNVDENVLHMVSRSIGTALVGGDVSGNARGSYAIDIQSYRDAVTKVASGDYSTAIGYNNTASRINSTAIGYNNTASGDYSTAIGRGCIASNMDSVAFGYVSIASGIDSSAIGRNDTASGDYGSAIGYNSLASGNKSTAIGFAAIARIEKTTNICGPQLIRKDDGEGAGTEFESFCGTEVVLMTKEVNLKAVAAHTLTLPTGCKFWLRECGLIATVVDTMTVQPTVSYGITGNTVKHGAALITTNLTAAGKMEIETPAVPGDGETSFVGAVTVAATATSMLGRFYFSGKLVESE